MLAKVLECLKRMYNIYVYSLNLKICAYTNVKFISSSIPEQLLRSPVPQGLAAVPVLGPALGAALPADPDLAIFAEHVLALGAHEQLASIHNLLKQAESILSADIQLGFFFPNLHIPGEPELLRKQVKMTKGAE